MLFGKLLSQILLVLLAAGDAASAAQRPANSVLLSNVKSLTLRKGLKTTSRRVSPIPQLQCIGGDAKGLYEVDVMRCKNAGADYDDENIQWTCTASLPEEFKLGSTDVICEGYDSPDDPYVLKGSCGVEYRLALTEKGLEKYGKGRGGWWSGDGGDWEGHTPWNKDSTSTAVAGLFWLLFLGVLFYMIFKGCIVGRGNPREPRTWTGPRFDGGGGGGGGWGGGPPPYDDPPPPYSPGYSRRKSYGTSGESWRPGFWSGALGGAAAGYFAGRQGNRNNNNNNTLFGGGGSRWNNAGAGPSGTYRSAPSSSSSSPSSTRYEGTGFGSTRRR